MSRAPVDAVEILDLEAAPAALDEAASATPGIATYCSASDWTLSAIAHLHAGRTPVVYRRDDAWVALSHGVHDDVGPYLQPLEADWGFASPLLGPDPRFAVELLGEVLRGAREWRVALLTGLPVGVASQVCTAMDRNNRVVFARRHETDLAYVFGGIIEDRYRGFQLGYDDDEATLGLGNQVQFAMIEHLAAEGVRSYDLGMEMAYKARWADELLRLYTVVIVKRG